MSGRLLVSILLAASLTVGGLTFYYQNYAFYTPVSLEIPAQPEIALTAPAVASGSNVVVPTLEAESDSPIAAPSSLDAPADQAEPSVDTTTATEPDTGLATSQTETNDDLQVAALTGVTKIRLTRVWDNLPEMILAQDFEGIDAPTSPLKFKGCFRAINSIPMMTETYVVYDDPTPIKAPIWFQCYRHKTITDDLESGEAVAFLGEANIYFGIDRVVAVYGDGRAYAWHQINACGEAAYAGNDLPAGCPAKPEG
ncbi:MAG: hypothetical protein ACI861_000968 [Paracoccaceae bacterium]|jgi:hypothetical protein